VSYYLDDATMQAIESDLAAAHQSLAGDLKPVKGRLASVGLKVLETALPAAGFSYLNARSAGGELMVGPVPADLGVGLSLALLSCFDLVGDDYEEHLSNVAMGAIASYAARTGAAFGAASASAAPQKTSGLEISGQLAHGPHNQPMLAARLRRMHHHVSGPTAHSPVPAGTQRFVVQQIHG